MPLQLALPTQPHAFPQAMDRRKGVAVADSADRRCGLFPGIETVVVMIVGEIEGWSEDMA